LRFQGPRSAFFTGWRRVWQTLIELKLVPCEYCHAPLWHH
jgi:hypothetical protein